MKAQWPGRILALGLVLVQTAGFLHLALASHQICREHGELVESGPAALSGKVVPEAEVGGTAAFLPGAEAELLADAHQHCVIVARRHDKALAPASAQLPVVVEAISPPRGEALIPVERVALWRVAPKQGPPAVA